MAINGKVLVVDGDPSFRKFLKTLFEASGLDVEAVSNGEDAVSKIENGDRPDLIILGLLFQGRNGLEILQELMYLNRSLKVVMTSCCDDYCLIEEAIRLGAQDYLVLPFENSELIGAMRDGKDETR